MFTALKSTSLRGALCLVCLVCLGVSGPAAREPNPSLDEVRALWVTRATLTSPDAIAAMIDAARRGGFNTLLVQVRGRGDAYYRSAHEPAPAELAARPGFDPLAEVLAAARPAGLKVHAWINVNFVSSAVSLPTSKQHVLYRHPEWLMVPRELAAEIRQVDPASPEYVGKLARWARAHADDVEGLYTSPIHSAAAAHVAAVAADVVANYAVDGVHLDYVRFPGPGFDYSPAALDQFKRVVRPHLSVAERRDADAQDRVDPLAYPTRFPDRWLAFRQSRLTTLVMRVRTAVKAANPAALLSAAVVPEVDHAAEGRLQDWRTWLEHGLIDVLCPMAYTLDSAGFERQIAAATAYAGGRPVWAGVGAYRLTTAATLQRIAAARRHEAAGIILFSYDALVTPPHSAASLTALGRAAFGAAGSQ